MAPVGAIWAPIAQRVLRHAIRNTSRLSEALRNKLLQRTGAEAASVEPIAVRVGPRQPIHPLAAIRQSKRGARWFSTSSNIHASFRRFLSSGPAPARHVNRTAHLGSAVASRAVWQSTGHTPFSSTLRPNLTGGAIPRTAGGYTLAGGRGVRHFSHTPAAPAQVVQNVSQAMRAFWTSGKRARFDGVGPNGEKRYAAVSAAQEDMRRRMKEYPRARRVAGSYVDFPVNPTITALSPLAAAFPYGGVAAPEEAAATLNAEGFLDGLSADFARALKDLAAVMSDLRRLETLGDLPIVIEKKKGGTALRVRFPGVDAESVENLCDDLGITRGLVGQDTDFDAQVGAPVALRFPFAPDEESRTITSPGGSLRSRRSGPSSELSEEEAYMQQYLEENPWLYSEEESAEEGYESMSPPIMTPAEQSSEDYEGLEGMYRFLEMCDRPAPKFSRR
jgi:hypothetical protein